jgi:hypothetical protein
MCCHTFALAEHYHIDDILSFVSGIYSKHISVGRVVRVQKIYTGNHSTSLCPFVSHQYWFLFSSIGIFLQEPRWFTPGYWLDDEGSIPDRGRKLLSLPLHPDWL